MCTNKSKIYTKDGTAIYVDCGYCPACLQSKAFRRTLKIRNDASSSFDSDTIQLFVTLTYSNEFIPCVKLSELVNAFVDYRSYYDRNTDTFVPSERIFVPLYRGVNGKVLDKLSLLLPDSSLGDWRTFPYKELTGANGYISICYYKDVQDFVKRLRTNLKRKYNYENNFRYFFCTEYGPSTCRAHIHGVLTIPSGAYPLFKTAISASWPFDCNDRAGLYTDVARNASSYVSSYVNCYSFIPPLLSLNKCTAPQSHYSKGYGLDVQSFSLSSVFAAILSGSLTFVCQSVVKGIPTVSHRPYPKYVISRYFPKIKGYCRLSYNALVTICLRPQLLKTRYYQEVLSYNDVDSHLNFVRLSNKIKFANSFGYNVFDYAYAYASVWSLYYSAIYRESLSFVQPINNLYAYDNIKDFYLGHVQSLSLADFVQQHPQFQRLSDPNDFPQNVKQTNEMLSKYLKSSKDRKVRNSIYSKTLNF